MLCIVCSGVLLSLQHYQQGPSWSTVRGLKRCWQGGRQALHEVPPGGASIGCQTTCAQAARHRRAQRSARPIAHLESASPATPTKPSQPAPTRAQAIYVGNAVLTGLFCVESLLKSAALGRAYFRSPWDLFDCLVTWASLPSEAAGGAVGAMPWRPGARFAMGARAVTPAPPHPPVGSAGVWLQQQGVGMVALRAVRVVRLGRLVRHLQGLKRIASALLIQLPSLCNAALVIAVVLFSFAIIGCEAFYGAPADMRACTPSWVGGDG